MDIRKGYEKLILQEEKEVRRAISSIKKLNSKLARDIEKEITVLMKQSGKWDYDELMKYGRLNKTLKRIEEEIKASRKQQYSIILGLLLYSGLRKQNITRESIETGKVELKNKDPKLIKEEMARPWSGATMKERYEKGTINEIDRVKQSVVKGAISGDIRESMSGLKKAIIVTAAAGAVAMMISEKTHIDMAITVKKAKRVLYSATLDSNTCYECSSRDGNEYYAVDAPMLPAHTNCRCFYIELEE